MAKRTQRQGTAGTPPAPRSYVLGGVLLVAVLLVLFVLGPSAEEEPSGAGTTPAAPEDAAADVGPPAEATDEDFCAGFVALANSQAAFVGGGEAAPEPLQEAADDLLAVGVPPAMDLPARTGYHAVLAGIYESIGMDLAPEAVGAASTAVEGADSAFTAYLDQRCPA
ncbi:hypothetical protein F4692_000450 [Nocardioides cavernae]|uniref:Uncharacterized protein n=1 Tax=Nocardioides cavernae TaxID=1921566 RepID=A0A7Y9GZT3_9ACTN|nr:hypothetical protein [Nocardioides cavernae]NYE35346.1 hypothetical protein [Nocardioides cavernae]